MEKVEMHVLNKSFSGYFGGVRFSRGIGIFEGAEKVKVAKELAARYGYEIVETEKAAEPIQVEVVEEKPKKRSRKATKKAGE